MKIRLEALIVGGPHDGYILSYEGSAESDLFEELESGEAKLVFEDHPYRIERFDREKLRSVAIW